MGVKRTMSQARYSKMYRFGYRTTVPMLPYTRMVQGLHAIGYTRRDLERLTGVPRKVLQRIASGKYREASGLVQQKVHLETARKIERAYSTLSVQPCHNTTKSLRARSMAIKHGWCPPLAWDDIYDPNDAPKGVEDRCSECESRGHKKIVKGLCEACYSRAVRAQRREARRAA